MCTAAGGSACSGCRPFIPHSPGLIESRVAGVVLDELAIALDDCQAVHKVCHRPEVDALAMAARGYDARQAGPDGDGLGGQRRVVEQHLREPTSPNMHIPLLPHGMRHACSAHVVGIRPARQLPGRDSRRDPDQGAALLVRPAPALD